MSKKKIVLTAMAAVTVVLIAGCITHTAADSKKPAPIAEGKATAAPTGEGWG